FVGCRPRRQRQGRGAGRCGSDKRRRGRF
ncbi:hypothetical protein BN1708_020270, partial [Verticillium longisporum]